MTRDELIVWASRHGLTVIATVHYQELCATAAAGITAQVDLDRGLAALLGR